MIADLKPYPAMKDSGVEWLGQVPAHWENRKLRTVLRNVTARNQPDLPLLSVVREKGVIVRNVSNQEENHNFIPDDLTNYKVVREGQFAMNKMKAWQGSYGVSRYNGIVSPAYFVFDLNDVTGDFFNVAIRSNAYVPFFTKASDGVRIGQWDLSQGRMREITFSVPSLIEQTAIVRFLDHFDRRIRRFIRAKQKLIKLLEEQRQAIIHRAVTRGLDPSVRLKPSGVEWLGDVPEHWDLFQVRRLISFVTSGSRGWAEFYSDDGDIFLQSGNLGRSMRLNLSSIQHVQPPKGAEGERTRVKRDDLLVCITGALTGNVVHVANELPASSFVNQHVALIRPNRAVVYPRYLAYALHSDLGRIQFKAGEYGGTKQGLGLDDVKSALVPFPTLMEQIAICRQLDNAMNRHVALVSTIEHKISLIREYRTRLIADVVTGKLDVREAALLLPDETEEPEPLDEAEALTDAEDITADDLDPAPEEAEA